MPSHLRQLKQKDHTDHDNIDDYKELRIFRIELNEIIIEHQSTNGSMLAEDHKC